MDERLEIGGVCEFLRARGAADAVVAWVDSDLFAVDLADPELVLAPPAEVAFEDRELLLRCLVHLLVRGPVRFHQVDGFREAGRQLGFEEDWIEALVLEELGFALERLWALGVLGLPLDATPAQVKRAHRQLVKDNHPDRMAMLDTQLQEQARQRTADVNQARDLLREALDEGTDELPLVFVEHDDDDVDLEPVAEEVARLQAPSLEFDLEWLYEDAPTEVEEEPEEVSQTTRVDDSITDAVERTDAPDVTDTITDTLTDPTDAPPIPPRKEP